MENTGFLVNNSDSQNEDIGNFLVPREFFTQGNLWSWGRNHLGQLGDNTTVTGRSSPVQTVAQGSNWKQVSCGYYHTTSIKTDGTLWSCGYNLYGELGDNTTVTGRSSPVQTVAQGNNWKTVGGGWFQTAGIKTDGTLWIWGENTYGALGDNSTTNKSSPVQTVVRGTNWKLVTGGRWHSAAIKTDGTLWTWGNNVNGQLGDSTTVTGRSSPVQTIAFGTDWKQVSCGEIFSAAIKTDGTLWTWGDNAYGQLGDNSSTLRSSPFQILASSNIWKQVTVSTYSTAAIKTDGTLWSWGSNTKGQLGDNTQTDQSIPNQTIAGGTNWNQVSSSVDGTVAIKNDGTLWTWGDNTSGQLGDSSNSSTVSARSSPVQTIAGGNTWQQVSGGNRSTTAIKKDGTLWTWGHNFSGELGDSTTTNRSSPVQTIALGNNWKQVSCGQSSPSLPDSNHTGAVKTDGTLWTWGNNVNGQLGDNTSSDKSSPVQTLTGTYDWKQVACGIAFTAAIKTDGTLWTWGNNGTGQLGDGTITVKYQPVQTIALGTNWKQVSAGVSHIAAIKTDGTLWTWGNNASGQLGDSTQTSRSQPVQTIAPGTDWKQVACGQLFTAAIKTDGTLWTWGSNPFGQLGDSTQTSRSSPVQTITGGTTWQQVACGQSFTAATKTDGTLWTWGFNGTGQLGDSTQASRSSPVQTIALGTNWKQVSAGSIHTVAVQADGTLWTWGRNNLGQLGDSTQTDRSIPIQTIVGGTNWNQVACGGNFTSAITKDGTLWTWGDNVWGQLGDSSNNSTVPARSFPVQTIAFGTNWQQVACGQNFTSAIKNDGTLWTWGLNSSGQLGDNTATSKSSPIQTLASSNNWQQVSMGYNFTSAIKTDGTLWTWGLNSNGKLGDSTTTSRSQPVQTIAGGTNWKQVACGQLFTAAIKTDGTLWTWGNNTYGKLGDNTRTSRSSPVQTIALGTDWQQVAGGYQHTSAIKTDGTLWTWGFNNSGELGDNTATYKSSPIQTLASSNNWKQVSCGRRSLAAVKTDGTLWTCGYNGDGELGDNTTTNRSLPVQTVAQGNNWKQACGGSYQTAGIKTDGTLWIWGYNAYGQLGDNSTTDKSSPVQTVVRGTNWKQLSGGRHHTSAIIEND